MHIAVAFLFVAILLSLIRPGFVQEDTGSLDEQQPLSYKRVVIWALVAAATVGLIPVVARNWTSITGFVARLRA